MKIKIGGIQYQVQFVEPSKLQENNDKGMVDFDNSIIYIGQDMCREQKEATLLHEIIHCVNSQFDEQTTEFLATAFYQIIKDNDFKNILK